MEEEKDIQEEKKQLSDLSKEEKEEIVEKWKKRFKKAKDFKEPYKAKWLRMYKLYRAYRDKSNYAYETNLMPATAFEIVETVKPRLVSAKMNIRILPRFKKDVGNESLESWDDKIKYDLDETDFEDKKSDIVSSALTYGDGYLTLTWGERPNGKEGPIIDVEDLWLLFPDPEMTDPQENGKYMIQLAYKSKRQLKDEEKARGKNTIYDEDVLEDLEEKPISDDPRKERYLINTKKMGIVPKGRGDEGSESGDKLEDEKKVELWQIWDYENDVILTIANETELIRYEPNPYEVINGRIFFNLQDHQQLWELWSIGHIEPVESTIEEIADSRNHAMDNIVMNLDPIRKKRKGAKIKDEDLKVGPGAIWELENVDDVITDRPPDISLQWLQKDDILKKEIQTVLAISEYAMGIPKGPQEPKAKVELLLMQTNIRFSILVRQLSSMMTKLVNAMILLNKEFLDENEEMRLLGEDVTFKEFTTDDKAVEIDAIVDIEPVVERTPERRLADALEAKRMFVDEAQPDPNNPADVLRHQTAKRAISKKILEELGLEQYEDLILGPEVPIEPTPEEPSTSGSLLDQIPIIPAGETQGVPEIPEMIPPEELAGGEKPSPIPVEIPPI